jgi:hypothetical protein
VPLVKQSSNPIKASGEKPATDSVPDDGNPPGTWFFHNSREWFGHLDSNTISNGTGWGTSPVSSILIITETDGLEII